MTTKPKRKCLCDLCTRISPMMRRISKALPRELRRDFDYLMMRLYTAEEDRDADEAKLNGTWPGWEWMVEARKKAEKV